VLDTSSSRSHLHISSLHGLDVAHAVFVVELSRYDVREDFEFSVRVSWETLARLFMGQLVRIDNVVHGHEGKKGSTQLYSPRLGLR
jgi:hypothetical protein